jgi:hypothetical protein
MAISILYSKYSGVQKVLRPVFKALLIPMNGVSLSIGLVLKVLLLPFKLLIGLFKPKSPKEELS